jgi:hypothetical protein
VDPGRLANACYQHIDVDGRKQNGKPEGVKFKPLGVIALANAIPDMRAMTGLNLASSRICWGCTDRGGGGGAMDGIRTRPFPWV